MNVNPAPASLSEGMRQTAADAYGAALGDEIPQILAMLVDICQTPTAALTLYRTGGVHVAAAVGPTVPGSWPRPDHLYELLIATGETTIIADATEHPWLAEHPLVAGLPEAGFAAAAPLYAGERLVGALCVADSRPHLIDLGLIERTLTALARRVDVETSLRSTAAPDWLAGLREADTDEVRNAVSHEIRTPLAAIQGYAEILSETLGPLDAVHQRQVDAINRNADRLCRTVEQLFAPAFRS